jgi:hypothetical protein
MVYDKKKEIRYVSHSSLGLIPLSLVELNHTVYFIASESVECLDVVNSRVMALPRLPYPALNAGCCSFEGTILVIGGLGNRRVLQYNIEDQKWSVAHLLSFDCANIA